MEYLTSYQLALLPYWKYFSLIPSLFVLLVVLALQTLQALLSSNFSDRYLLVCFLSMSAASVGNSDIISFFLVDLSFVNDFKVDVNLAPDDLIEFLNFTTDLNETLVFLFLSFSLMQL